MTYDLGIRALRQRFGDQSFRVAEIPDSHIREVASLFGIDTPTQQGTRSQLGRRLTALGQGDGWATTDLAVVLKHIPTPDDLYPGLYQVHPYQPDSV